MGRRRRPPQASTASRLRSSRLRSFGSSKRLRNRIDFGVISTNSSSSMYASAFSSVIRIGGVRRTASSLDVVRMLVSCLPLRTLISRSLSRVCSPTIMPRYTFQPGSIIIGPRSSSFHIA